MKAKKTFAELRCCMIRKNINQSELAEVAGIADVTMTDRMSECNYFRVDEITRMAKLLDIPEGEYYRFFFVSENYPSAQCSRGA